MNNDKYDEIWRRVSEQVKQYENIDSTQVTAIFSRLKVQAFSEGFILITTDSSFIQTWAQERYTGVIKEALEELYNVPFEVVIEIDITQENPATTTTNTVAVAPKPVVEAVVPAEATIPTPAVPQPITADTDTKKEFKAGTSALTFQTFVIGNSNRMAYSMAVAVAENPGRAELNPLFIYGKSGLGKTHLLRAIQNYIQQEIPQLKTVYVDAMELVSGYADAAAHGGNTAFNSFKQQYESADILLVDDVQGLQRKNETLNMVFQIFNKMLDTGHQVVLSADRSPNKIDIDERYKSRFSQGGTIDIQSPEVETKLGIIRSYSETCKNSYGCPNVKIPDEMELFIAENSSSNIRELKGCVATFILQMKSDMNSNGEQAQRSMDEYKHLAGKLLSGGNLKKITIAGVQRAAEEYYGISHAEMVGRQRTANIAHARHVAIYLCRTMIDIPHSEVGEGFNRDHTTVIYSIKSIEEKLKEDREVAQEIEIIRQMIME